MTKQTEALRMAIEAMELHGNQYPHMVKGYILDAIQACKEALEPTVAELNDEYLRDTHVEGMPKDGDCCTEGCIKCDARKVLAETQEPKPPTILARLPNGATVSNVYEAYEAGLKEGKAETQEPILIQWYDEEEDVWENTDERHYQHYADTGHKIRFLYTTPPSREWQSLSDYLISELWYKSQNDIEGVNLGFTTQEHFFAGLIDANLREKNT